MLEERSEGVRAISCTFRSAGGWEVDGSMKGRPHGAEDGLGEEWQRMYSLQ